MSPDLYSTQQLQQLIRKDEKPFHGLYDRYAGALYGIICREVGDRSVADELLQQTFVQAWQQFGQYEQERDNIFMWLIRQCCTVLQQHTGSSVDLAARLAPGA
ncbi:MAG: hypothetical protein JNL13_05510 [Chitinophagaceae bacterium]|nr:hypothetical protein [Chitinophagaceae bacterium]